MSMRNPYQSYEQNAVNTASPGELTLMLYNGCLKFINFAKRAIEQEDIAAKNTNLQKAQNIISELMVTLNMEIEISKNMMGLYDYMNRRLIEANIKNDLEILLEVESMMTELRDTWKEAIQLNRQNKYAESSQA